ncbi:MAG TPA: peptidoglycan DD-metalloendopeptidase family protein [Gallionella sp.]
MKQIFAWLAMASLLAGCASSGKHAPVVEHSAAGKINAAKATAKKNSADKDGRPKVHVVQKGDTLYAIAFNYGVDPHELAELNNIQDPNLIQVGQQLSLFSGTAVPRPVAGVESRPTQSLVKDQPKVVKYAYSEAAVAKAEAVQTGGEQDSSERSTPVIAKVETKPKPESKPDVKPDNKALSTTEGEDALEWSMPTQGKLVGSFSESDNRKGIDISGKLGQPIFASAPGKVVYSGSGLRGYGKLLIIKHNKTYLSAYAHNDQLLVKEGETVTRGQKIAEMGNTDSDQVKLHFEVRRLGKPVDPANYLSLNKP